MSYVFYDTETTGTDTSFDQILQFAAIRTDNSLKELERFEIRSRVLPNVVPSPGAMRVTGITASKLIDRTLPSHYEMVCAIREKLLSWSPSLFLGYNSIQFDEHLLRQAFYKTLHPPYLTNFDGNSRSDVLRIVQAASLFAPNALTFPVDDSGKRIFKLDRVAPQNGFGQKRAHEAMADVEATIHLFRLLQDRAPDVWSSFMRFSQKAAVTDYISDEAIFCFSDFFFGKPYSALVTKIGSNPDNSSEHYLFDLSADPDELAPLSDEKLAKRLARSPKVVRGMRSNGSPMIRAADDAPSIAAATKLSESELNRRAQRLRSDPALCEKLVAAYRATQEEKELSPHVEKQLYDGFFLPADQQRMARFHTLPWAERVELVEQFEDERLKIIGRNLIYVERPDLLDPATRRDHDQRTADRLLGATEDAPWLTVPKALEEVGDLIAAGDGTGVQFLQEHRSYLAAVFEKYSAMLE